MHSNFEYDVCADEGMVDGVFSGNVLRYLISKNYDLTQFNAFFMCGPPPMIEACEKFLRDKAVPDERIHFEKY